MKTKVVVFMGYSVNDYEKYERNSSRVCKRNLILTAMCKPTEERSERVHFLVSCHR